MSLKNLQSSDSGIDHPYYENLPMFCAQGVHEAIFSQFLKLNRTKDVKILVLGSGSGSFEKRLLNNGFNNITSIEFIPENFMLEEIDVLPVDLNSDFSNIGKFDVVFAIEIIEHLENHFNFFRCVKNIMNTEGVLYLSTPNIENSFARIKYFLTGRLHYFSKSELKGTGHINPVFAHILSYNLSQNNLKIEKYFSNYNIWRKLLKNKSYFKKGLYVIMFLSSLFILNKNNFEINLYEIKNDTPPL